MYQILIVDDEQLMREYLQYNIPILCPHFSVTGVASDGLEAVQLLNKQTFHVVITDIKMPEMDGLKLADYINTHFPKIKTIIISGYSEFNYAKQAIKYNVDDYLLKPLVDDEMKEVLQKIHEEFIQDEKQLAADPLDDNSRFSAIINNPDSAYLPICQENDCEAYAVLSISIGYLSMVLENPSLENIYMHQQHIFSLCIKYAESHHIPYYPEQGNLYFLLRGQDENDLVYQAKEINTQLMQLKIGHTFFKLITSLGYIVDSYAQIPLSFETSTQGNILTLCNIETPILPLSIKANQDFIKKLGSVCDLIYTDYICENNERIISDLSSYVSLLYSDINIATVLNFGAYLINEIQTRGKIKTKYAEAAFAQLFQCVNKHIENSDLNTSDIALDYLCTLKSLKTGIIDEPQTEQQTLIDRAKEYICLHYNEPISLSTIADALEVTPSYLSNLFHKTLGEPYSKYVTRIRMEQALLILKNNPNEKIYNVAAMTGFVSTKHFISVFKKHYGMSPTNYLASDRTCL